MVEYVYNSDICESEAQLLCVRFPLSGIPNDEQVKKLTEKFPHILTHNTKNTGKISYVGGKDKRKIIVMITQTVPGNSDSSEDRIQWFKQCLSEINKRIPKATQLDFPSSYQNEVNWKDYQEILHDWATRNPNIKIRVLSILSKPKIVRKISSDVDTDAVEQIKSNCKRIEEGISDTETADNKLSINNNAKKIIKIGDLSDEERGQYYDWFYNNPQLIREQMLIYWKENCCTVHNIKVQNKEKILNILQTMKENKINQKSDEPVDKIVITEKIEPIEKNKEEKEKENNDEDEEGLDKEDITYKNCTFKDMIETFTPEGWEHFFSNSIDSDCIEGISMALENESKKYVIYPPMPLLLNAFDLLPFDKIKIILVGMDPYIKEGQAMGLCFSVNKDVKVPPSLLNIYKELQAEGFKVKDPKCGDLSSWCKKGVFLINTALTVREGESGSHLKVNIWGDFTSALFSYINIRTNKIVIMAFGTDAKKACSRFDLKKHRFVYSPHPSPLNTKVEFLGSKPFTRANEALKELGHEIIDWSL